MSDSSYPTIRLKKHIFEDTRWTDNFFKAVGKAICMGVYDNILQGHSEVLIVLEEVHEVQGVQENHCSPTTIKENGEK